MNRRPFYPGIVGCAALFAVALLTGCQSRRMVVGLYDVPISALPSVADAGFNVVTMPAITNRFEYLRTARENGVKVIAWPGLKSRDEMENTGRIGQHTAVQGWYLEDEPDLHLIAPSKLRHRQRLLRTVSRKPTYLVVASGTAVEKYKDCADVMIVDCYPVPWAPLATVSREMRAARLALGGERPFLALLQAFDWSAYPTALTIDSELRPPSEEEIRCMAYLSLFQGAKGLLFYTHSYKGWQMEEHPEVWTALTNVVADVRSKAAIFSERVAWWPARTRYTSGQMHNDLHEGSMVVNLFRLRKPARNLARGYYAVAINTTDRPVGFGFKLPFGGVTAVGSTCSPHEITFQQGWVQKTYSPYEVCIFGPIDQEMSSNPEP